jgi:hypothetical protein
MSQEDKNQDDVKKTQDLAKNLKNSKKQRFTSEDIGLIADAFNTKLPENELELTTNRAEALPEVPLPPGVEELGPDDTKELLNFLTEKSLYEAVGASKEMLKNENAQQDIDTTKAIKPASEGITAKETKNEVADLSAFLTPSNSNLTKQKGVTGDDKTLGAIAKKENVDKEKKRKGPKF